MHCFAGAGEALRYFLVPEWPVIHHQDVKLNERNVFLLDGIGAAVSATCTGLLLPQFSQWTGIPWSIATILASPALAFSIYSLTCFWRLKAILPIHLSAIIVANISYSLISLAIAFSLNGILFWGRTYLIAEVFVVAVVVGLEISIYRRSFGRKRPTTHPGDQSQ